MPSFVPYCDFEIATNWYRLDNPRSTELSTHATMKLSRSVRQMQDSAAICASQAHLYREGEVQRLLNRVEQLERELPFQTMRVQIPYENTLGGFELFSNGVTDFAPELVGWYGAPGIKIGGDACCPGNCQRAGAAESQPASADESSQSASTCNCEYDETLGQGTTIFLVGRSFSVHETQVIAGGVKIPRNHIKMVSRQVISITVPTCASTISFAGREYVDVHAATPYGVTNHLHVPAVSTTPQLTVMTGTKGSQNSEDVPAEAGTSGDSPRATAGRATAQLALDAQWKAEVDAQLQRLNELVTTYEWDVPDTLIVTSSFALAKDIRSEARPTGEAQLSRVQIVLNHPPESGEPFQLSWQHGNGFQTTGAGQSTEGRARIAGQFYIDNKPVGSSFWFAGDKFIQLYRTKQISFTSTELLEAIRTGIESQLTLDATGNEPAIDLELQTWVVPTLVLGQGSEQFEQAVDRPQSVSTRLPLKIVRRVLPTTSQQLPIDLPPILPGPTEKLPDPGTNSGK